MFKQATALTFVACAQAAKSGSGEYPSNAERVPSLKGSLKWEAKLATVDGAKAGLLSLELGAKNFTQRNNKGWVVHSLWCKNGKTAGKYTCLVSSASNTWV